MTDPDLSRPKTFHSPVEMFSEAIREMEAAKGKPDSEKLEALRVWFTAILRHQLEQAEIDAALI